MFIACRIIKVLQFAHTVCYFPCVCRIKLRKLPRITYYEPTRRRIAEELDLYIASALQREASTAACLIVPTLGRNMSDTSVTQLV